MCFASLKKKKIRKQQPKNQKNKNPAAAIYTNTFVLKHENIKSGEPGGWEGKKPF